MRRPRRSDGAGSALGSLATRGAVLVLGAALLGGGSAAVVAHVRLHNPSNSAPLFWQNPESIGIVIHDGGSDDIPDGSHETALRSALASWNDVTGTTVRLVEDASDAAQARTDWESDDIHLMYFDENNSSGYFPSGSGTVAITPVWFFSNGRISDADVLFNGSGFHFTTKKETGKFDVQDVAAHELGHLLGLDHSGWAGGTMYPFVDPTVILHRSLSLDEFAAVRDVYPANDFGVVLGRILRSSDGTPVAGAHVVARTPAGRTAGGTLAREDGTFQLRGLEAGSYEVYATPLDEPVSAANLTSGHVVDVDFESALYAELATVADGTTEDLGDLLVGDDVFLNLGRSFDRYPRRVIAGLSSWIIIRGTGLTFGSTLECSDPDVEIVPLDWVGFQVNFQCNVPAGAAPGHVDLTVTDPGGHISILPAALEITPPSPVVAEVTPSVSGKSGGSVVDVRGTGFLEGCRVVVGDQIYVHGQDPELELVDGTHLRLTTRATVPGLHDVVVVDASGVEGRLAHGLEMASVPRIDSVFPAVGAADGGTLLVVTGADFQKNAAVRIGDAVQTQVTRVDATRLEIVTDPGTAGGPYDLEVVNPGGYVDQASGAFAFVGQPDPVLAEVTPAEGPAEGGEAVELAGEDLPEGAVVRFGVDPTTGTGGVEVESVTFESASRLSVVTPSSSAGAVAVLVMDPDTGQQTVLPAAYTYVAPQPSGGGCGTVAPRPDGPAGALGAASWMLALLALTAIRRHRALGRVRA